MTQDPETNDSLLVRICDPKNREAWSEFVSIYQPLIYRVAKRYGLQDADAENLFQEVLRKVDRQTSTWESGQPNGSFRRWLTTVARHTAIDSLRKIRPDAARGGTSVHDRLHRISQQDDESDVIVQRELEREAFRRAARQIRDEFTDSTWNAFWQTMVEGYPCTEVASRLQKSIGAVYTARSRVMKRLREEVDRFEWNEVSS